MNKLFLNNLGDLGEVQKASFYRFLYQGISEELNYFPNPLSCYLLLPTRQSEYKIKSFLFLQTNKIKFKGPSHTIQNVLENELTYSLSLYIPSEYSYIYNPKTDFVGEDFLSLLGKEFLREEDAEIKGILSTEPEIIFIKQDILFGELPFMTEEGTFILNGCEKVIISQIIRSPGVYFQKQFSGSKRAIYTATIISNRGLWTQIHYDEVREPITKKLIAERMYIRLNEYRKKNEDEKMERELYSSDEVDEDLYEKEELEIIEKNDATLKQELRKEKQKEEESEDEEENFKIEDLKDKEEDEEEKVIELDLADEEDSFHLYEILEGFGLTDEQIYDSLDNAVFTKWLQKSRKITRNEDDELSFFFKANEQFFNPESGCFSIGKTGRYRINKQLELNLPKEVTYLTACDFLKILDGLIELKYGDRLSDDIDHIRNKQIRSIGELLQNQFRIACFKLQRRYPEVFLNPEEEEEEKGKEKGKPGKTKKTIDEILKSDEILEPEEPVEEPEEIFDFHESGESTEFVDSKKLPDFIKVVDWKMAMWMNNYVLDSNYITHTIREFFMTSPLSQFMDQTNPLAELTHKRRISVFGPNGLKRDHISTVIRDIHPSQYGRLCPIETPEGQNAGLISSIAMFGRVAALGWIETPYFLLKNRKVFSEKTPIYLNPEQEANTKIAFCDLSLNKKNKIKKKYLSVKDNYFFVLKKSKDVNFFTTSPLQLISLATSLIPFIEHDDANRALMGSNMQRQAVPLIFSQKAIVGTGFEAASVLDSQLVIKNYHQGTVERASSLVIIIKDTKEQKIHYFLKKYKSSNQETCINQRPIVWSGENVYSGQIIADAASTNDGELALGRNLSIAYMPWEGYNYEDAIVISERLVIEDCLTSIHIDERESAFKDSLNGLEKITNDLPCATKHIRRHLDKNGIVKVGSYVKEHDILVGKVIPDTIFSPERNLMKVILGREKEPSFRDISLKVSTGTEGRVVDIRTFSTKFSNTTEDQVYHFRNSIKISIAQIRKIQIGDKLAGRHGNKGVISRILSRQDMPYLPDGTPIDIILNPLGVPSRMNVGQVFECLLGLAGEHLQNRFKVTPFDEIYGKEASRILVNQKLKEAAFQTSQSWLFNPYSPGKILLRDGRTGEYFDNPITVGKSYILKLIHLVEDKIHARAIGPYAMITEQPLAGKSQKGGQRFGEMEVWALEAYGCSYTLQELLTSKSDDIDGRRDMYQTILFRMDSDSEGIPESKTSVSEAFLVLIRELNSLGFDFSVFDRFNTPELLVKRELDTFANFSFGSLSTFSSSSSRMNVLHSGFDSGLYSQKVVLLRENEATFALDEGLKQIEMKKETPLDFFEIVEKRLKIRALLKFERSKELFSLASFTGKKKQNEIEKDEEFEKFQGRLKKEKKKIVENYKNIQKENTAYLKDRRKER
jgi:DNA-directed RNA polymerase beta subunit